MGLNSYLDRKHGFGAIYKHQWGFSRSTLFSGSDGPKYCEKLISPQPFSSIQTLLQVVQNLLVSWFKLLISFRPCNSCKSHLYAIVSTIISQFIGIKLSAIIEDNCLRHSKASDNVLPYELPNFPFSNGYKCFRFDSFGNVIDDYKKELALTIAFGKRPNMPMPHFAKGNEERIVVDRVEG